MRYGDFFCGLFLAALTAGAAFTPISTPPQFPTGMRLTKSGDDISVELRGTVPPQNQVRGTVVCDGKKYPFSGFPAQLKFPAAGEKFRLSVELEYRTPTGRVRRRDTLLNGREFLRSELDGPNPEIAFELAVPAAGKLTAVIDGTDGVRVRNLVSARPVGGGTFRLTWDGRDESGAAVPPGRYQLRTLTHPGLAAVWLGQYGNFGETTAECVGANHSVFTALTADGGRVFAAAPLTEGGFNVVELSPDGKFRRGFPQLGGAGIDECAVAAGDGKLCFVSDGYSLRGRKNAAITLVTYDLKTGTYLGNRPAYSILHQSQRPTDPRLHGEHRALPRNRFALRGAAMAGGVLYVANGETRRVMSVDPATGRVTRTFAVPEPTALTAAADGQTLLVGTRDGSGVGRLNPADGKFDRLFALPYPPLALAARDGKIAIAGNPDHTVEIRDAVGKLRRTVGVPGGPYEGRWIPERLVNPVGAAFAADGTLWIAENRWNPKRLTRWSAGGKLLSEKTGPPYYGSPGGGFDRADSMRRIGLGVLWNGERPAAVLQKSAGHLGGKLPWMFNYRFVRRDGRTFLIGQAKGVLISELRSDGSLRDLAWIANAHQMGYALRNNSGAAIDTESRTRRGAAAIWIDRNGDGKLDDDEFQYGPMNTQFGDFNWAARVPGFAFRVTGRDADGVSRLYTVAPEGYNAVGAPRYDLAKILQTGQPLPGVEPENGEALNFDDGTLAIAASPNLLGYDAAGKLRWRFPNRWAGVHGSHTAPLPRPGEMRGVLGPLGSSPLPGGNGEIGAFLGNFGQIFVLTSDGLYVDELFHDCRVCALSGPDLLGGEPFGGVLEFDAKRGETRLQAGHGGYRVYRIDGLDRLRRETRNFEVTPAQAKYAAAREPESVVPEETPRPAVLRVARGNPGDWRSIPAVRWRAGARWAHLQATADERALHLRFRIDDPSPWRNTGTDWTQYFKTGDSVDLQLTGPDGPVRLSIAPGGATFYRFRGPERNAVTFASPWRAVRVPDVRRAENVKYRAQAVPGSYTLTAGIPWRELGMSAPKPGETRRGDVGVILGDRDGTVNLARCYLFNRATGLVNDIPGEIEPPIQHYGTIRFD